MADDRGLEIGSAEVAKRLAVLRPHLVDGVPLTRVAEVIRHRLADVIVPAE
ncbi:hypothetical protein [Sphingomonas sp. Leaf20]|uniref:hypothetical protein n=1 Tax=Sphingomonas sp. Leaf20 TaxID=1735685 RepID=UPI000A5B7873|nr:hypothetical protein [Sphingomonas sp. Leaf20]